MNLKHITLILFVVATCLGSPIKPNKKMARRRIDRHRMQSNRRYSHNKIEGKRKLLNKKSQNNKSPSQISQTKTSQRKHVNTSKNNQNVLKYSNRDFKTLMFYGNRLTDEISQDNFFNDLLNNNIQVTHCRKTSCKNGRCLAVRNKVSRVTTEFCKCKKYYGGKTCEYYLSVDLFSPIGKKKSEVEAVDIPEIDLIE